MISKSTVAIAEPIAIKAQLVTNLPSTKGLTEAPPDIQWMPPGKRTIDASSGGKPSRLKVDVNEAGAKRVAAALEELLAKAEANEGDRPFIDFDHEAKRASGRPTRMWWGGDDKKTGGIRMALDWTPSGAQAVLSDEYHRFSPEWLMDPDTGEILGLTGECLGGLVNQAAFRTIRPVKGKHAPAEPDPSLADPQPQTPPIMKLLAAALVSAGLLSKPDLSDEDAAAELATRFSAHNQESSTAKARVVTLETELAAEKVSAKAARTKYAEHVVAHSSLPPQGAAVRARWVELITENPDNVALLESSAPADAAAALAKRVVTPSAEEQQKPKTTEATKAAEPTGINRIQAAFKKQRDLQAAQQTAA